MTKTTTSPEPGSAPLAPTAGPSGESGPFKRPADAASPRGGGIKKRLGIPATLAGPQNNVGARFPNRGRVNYGRGRTAFQQHQNRFRYANAVINGNRNGILELWV